MSVLWVTLVVLGGACSFRVEKLAHSNADVRIVQHAPHRRMLAPPPTRVKHGYGGASLTRKNGMLYAYAYVYVYVDMHVHMYM